MLEGKRKKMLKEAVIFIITEKKAERSTMEIAKLLVDPNWPVIYPHKHTQNVVDNLFFYLAGGILELPITKENKKLLFWDTVERLYVAPTPLENGNYTYGVKTEWQLDRFTEQFDRDFKKLRKQRVIEWSVNIDGLEPSKAIKKIKHLQYPIKKRALFAELEGKNPNEWEDWLIRFFDNELEHQFDKSTKLVKTIATRKDKELREWILPDLIPKFEEIENQLYNDGFLDIELKWNRKKTQKQCIDFYTLIKSKYFKPVVRGRRISDSHKRNFIAKRYGFTSQQLMETSKKYKPTMKMAKATFYLYDF